MDNTDLEREIYESFQQAAAEIAAGSEAMSGAQAVLVAAVSGLAPAVEETAGGFKTAAPVRETTGPAASSTGAQSAGTGANESQIQVVRGGELRNEGASAGEVLSRSATTVAASTDASQTTLSATDSLTRAAASVTAAFQPLASRSVAASMLGVTGSLPSTVAQAATGEESSGVSKVLSTALTSGFGVGTLISGLLGIFGGSSDTASTTTYEKYSLPDSIAVEQASVGSGVADVVYDQTGMPRVVGRQAASESGTNSSQSEYSTRQTQAASTAATTINLTVQALDSQSFLDRSQDIARAVREAMLNMNSINDVVNDL